MQLLVNRMNIKFNKAIITIIDECVLINSKEHSGIKFDNTAFNMMNIKYANSSQGVNKILSLPFRINQ